MPVDQSPATERSLINSFSSVSLLSVPLVCSGLKYIHSAHVIHRDLKPSNLLLNSNCDLKICDFGLARGTKEEADYELTEYVVTRWYRAPEVMCSCQEYDHKIDVWSVGCILAELHGRKPLFPGDDYIKQMNLIFGVLGTPSKDDMKFITNEKALEYIKSLKKKPKITFDKIYRVRTQTTRSFTLAAARAADVCRRNWLLTTSAFLSVPLSLVLVGCQPAGPGPAGQDAGVQPPQAYQRRRGSRSSVPEDAAQREE